MSREIKFRGRAITGIWVYGGISVKSHGSFINNEDLPYDDCCAVIPETVGQYTGLLDRRGKEIYEGDLLEGFIEEQSVPLDNMLISNGIKVRCCVKWSRHESMFYFYCRQLKRPLSIVDELWDYEVIGNIWQREW